MYKFIIILQILINFGLGYMLWDLKSKYNELDQISSTTVKALRHTLETVSLFHKEEIIELYEKHQRP